jgi:hypothetical protein
MRNQKAAGNAGYRIVLDEQPIAYDHVLPLQVSCGEVMVILKLAPNDEFVVIGCLAEMDLNYITFDYVVLDKTLEDRFRQTGVVLLKRDRDRMASLEQIPCVIVSDSEEPEASLFCLRVRRCVLRRIGH